MYPAISKLWENAWEEFIPFVDYDVEIRRVTCSTNAIESLPARYRRAVRARGHFPNDTAALKCLYLVTRLLATRSPRSSLIVVAEVKEKERKLLYMHYEARITRDLFDEEQARLNQEREDAQALVARLNIGYEDVAATLEDALQILGEDLHALYVRADDHIRRLINQAIFSASTSPTTRSPAPSWPSRSHSYASCTTRSTAARQTRRAAPWPSSPPPSTARTPKRSSPTGNGRF